MHGFSGWRDAASKPNLRNWQLRISGKGESLGIDYCSVGNAQRRRADFWPKERGLDKKALQDAGLVTGKEKLEGIGGPAAWRGVQAPQQGHSEILLILLTIFMIRIIAV